MIPGNSAGRKNENLEQLEWGAMVSGGDCQWFEDEFQNYWINGFCLTFIAGKPADLVKDILHFQGALNIESEDPQQLFMASLHDVEKGSIILELGGHAGYQKRIADLLSQDTRIVIIAHFIMGSPKFAYVENGILVCGFGITDPDSRGGRSPDFLLPNLTAVGLLPTIDYPEPESEEEEAELDERAAQEESDQMFQAISIATQLTGVPFTRQLMKNPRHHLLLANLQVAGNGEVFAVIF